MIVVCCLFGPCFVFSFLCYMYFGVGVLSLWFFFSIVLCYLLCVISCLLFGVCCWCSLCVVGCWLFGVCSLLCVVCGLLVRFFPLIVQCWLLLCVVCWCLKLVAGCGFVV